MKKRLVIIFMLAMGLFANTYAQENKLYEFQVPRSDDEQKPETDSRILQAVSEWQDLKFGFFMHWGMYAQKQVVESWSICNEEWIDRKGEPYEKYKQDYWNLATEFNPKQFNPDKWAEAAQRGGMKYVVFTTKHHDGFCMYDTKETDYKITNPNFPFGGQDGRDVTGEVVKSFRNKDFKIGLYFSKADWHNEDYWSPLWATPDRNVNYSIEKHPDMWQRFCDFTTNQIKEITHNYGKIDILWLDAGWICPLWSVMLDPDHQEWIGKNKRIQDINMPKIAKIAREKNPAMIIVDRTIGGKYENYRTPEQAIPDAPLDYPWETCMTMGDSWSYVANDNYKSTNKLIHLLIDVVCKGGNFLLNVGPDELGNLPQAAVSRMDSIGAWLNVNGKAIYSTRPIAPYKQDGICYTQGKDGQIYALILIDDSTALRKSYDIPAFDGMKKGSKKILGTKQKASLRYKNGAYTLNLNANFIKKNKERNAIVVEL